MDAAAQCSPTAPSRRRRSHRGRRRPTRAAPPLHPGAEELGDGGPRDARCVNAHQHLTGDRLMHSSSIPDDLPPGAAIFEWAVPVHAAHTGDDDELSATLRARRGRAQRHHLRGGGRHRRPSRPGGSRHTRTSASAARSGTWGWDVEQMPWAGTCRRGARPPRPSLALTVPGRRRVEGWVTLVGHDLMSDELLRAASDAGPLAGTGSRSTSRPTDSDPQRLPGAHRACGRWCTSTARRALGPHVLVAHGVHLDDDELDGARHRDRPSPTARGPTSVWARASPAPAPRRAGRARRPGGARLRRENAGDAVDVLRAAALAAGLAKDTRATRTRFGAHTCSSWRPSRGAEASAWITRSARSRSASGGPGGARHARPRVPAHGRGPVPAARVGHRRPVRATRGGGRRGRGSGHRCTVDLVRRGSRCGSRRSAAGRLLLARTGRTAPLV
jgi:hypothetical protein